MTRLHNCDIIPKLWVISKIDMPLLSLTRQVIFLVPLLLLLPLVFPVPIDGILFAGPIADGAAFLTSVLLVRHEMARIRQQELAQTQ